MWQRKVLRAWVEILTLHTRPQIQPRHVVVPALFAQLIVGIGVMQLPLQKALWMWGAGNLLIIALAMLPGVLQKLSQEFADADADDE